MADGLVLIAYDDSPGAAHAIEVAGTLLQPRRACIVSVWGPVMVSAPVAGGVPAYMSDIEPHLEQEARETAERGAQAARQAGFEAEAKAVRGDPAWRAIVETAATLGAEAIVVGARGRSGLASAILGSTSNAVLHHTELPVLVVRQPGER